ncbi:hypothetical protein CERSUDRAFT_111271 [Gelatoporia subvermispora B]|uniref:RING-type domain-containing protein n=1 Tax=Ceriporiopsis subvermispora (strain B) TaxID=914234 RepID=M2RP98_CERS8|nr:hypothetical protein CERSUDRAFT_111271 [Gelatoporia subvermispora B]
MPLTTPCQHTFCTRCLQRSLDHSSACPLCRTTLPEYAYFLEHPCNKVVRTLLLHAFHDEYTERGAAIQEEEHNSGLDTPIFVCQLSFPGIPTKLHLFEPRYRLMLRRCLETEDPKFGMIPPPSRAGDSQYGTMLAIKSVQWFQDGRSLVETCGIYRFRILARGTRDGYVVGRVEQLDDLPEEDSDANPSEEDEELGTAVRAAAEEGPGPRQRLRGAEEAGAGASSTSSAVSLPPVASSSSHPSASASSPLPTPPGKPRAPSKAELLATCHAFLAELRQGTPWVVERLRTAYVPMPDDPAQFSFWMALLLPIDEHEKAKLLPIRSPRLRLRLVVHWIEQLRSQWPASHASAPSQVVLRRLRGLVGYVSALVLVFVLQRLLGVQ